MENNNQVFTAFLALWSGLIAFLAPIQLILILIFTVIVFDLITGYIASIKKNHIIGLWKKLCHFKSEKGKKSIGKMFFYITFTGIIFLTETALIGFNSVYITKFSTFLIVFVELKSICENMDIITGKDVFTSLFIKIRKLFEKKLSENVTEKDSE